MEINKHICFREEENSQLLAYLISNGIPYEDCYGMLVFDIYESNPHWKTIEELLSMGSKKAFCLSNTIYTKKEREAAQWLTLRSKWMCGYPQPEEKGAYEAVTYCESKICPDCGGGMEQISDFRMRKTPKWGKRHFMMLNWIGDELFVDDIAKELLMKSGLSGFYFQNVRDKKGVEILTDINQLVIPTLLPLGFVTDRRSTNFARKCPQCGVLKHHTTGIGQLAFRREIFDNAPDFVKTGEIYGWEYWTQRKIIVSQRVYKTLIEHQLDRGLVFEPLELV